MMEPQAPTAGAHDETGGTAETGIVGHRAAILVGALILGVVSFQLNSSMLTPALPNIAESFGVGPGEVAPVSSFFFLAGAMTGPVIARWSDFIGRRTAMLLVLATMAFGTVLCILAPSLWVLVLGRFLQGCSSGVFGLSYLILGAALPRRLFGIAVGAIAAINGGVGGVDGFLGGLMADAFGYRSIFIAVLVLTVVAVVSIVVVVPGGRPDQAEGHMDWLGAGLLSVLLACITLFFSEGSSIGWTSPLTVGLGVGANIVFVVFWIVEGRSASPLIAPRHLRSRQVWSVVATTVLMLSGIFAILNFTAILLTQDAAIGFGLSAAMSALLILTPSALIGVAFAPLAGWIAGRRGWVPTLRVGSALCVVPAVVAALAWQHKWVLVVALATLGISYYGVFLTTINGLSVLLSPADEPGALPGINGSSFGIGASLGVVVVAPFAGLGTAVGYTTALWISAGLTLAAFAVSLLVPAPEGDAQ
jgi:predicted MFS family arabinose efflux permease